MEHSFPKLVCQSIRYATPKEKAQLQAELEAHIDDHTEALLAAGYDADHACQQAEEAMGDPEEVSKALNAAFPRRWWILSRLAALALVAAVLVLALSLPSPVDRIHAYYQAKYDPMAWDWHKEGLPEMVPLDLKYDLPGGNTLVIYAAGLTEAPEGYQGYTAYLRAVSYTSGPFQYSEGPAQYLTFTWAAETPLYLMPMGDSRGCRYQALYQLNNLPAGTDPVAHLDYNGTHLTIPIPLPWEEVIP